jgi:hypothetical protein
VRLFSDWTAHGDDIWLEGQIIGPENEFVFNGRLFSQLGHVGTIFDNFPRASMPGGWTRRVSPLHDGYDLVGANGETIFAYRVDANRICHITVDLYTANGSLAAHGGQGALVTHVPTMLGRNGKMIG